jgi:hypothetical protein
MPASRRSSGIDYYLKFLALVSISLGVLNLLPIPILDGGHLMYYLVEIIKRGPLSPSAPWRSASRSGFAIPAHADGVRLLQRHQSTVFRLKMKKNLLAGLVATFCLCASGIRPVHVKDIRVEGIQRTEAGTVFSYLPVKVGDTLTDEKAAQAIKALVCHRLLQGCPHRDRR